jgi:hypothetical protein
MNKQVDNQDLSVMPPRQSRPLHVARTVSEYMRAAIYLICCAVISAAALALGYALRVIWWFVTLEPIPVGNSLPIIACGTGSVPQEIHG